MVQFTSPLIPLALLRINWVLNYVQNNNNTLVSLAEVALNNKSMQMDIKFKQLYRSKMWRELSGNYSCVRDNPTKTCMRCL